MHRHRHKDGATPFVGDGEATSENEERRERWQMRVDRGEEQRAHEDPHESPKIAAGHSVNKKTEDEFLGERRERNGEDDNKDPLIQRCRFTEHLHDGLSLRRTAQQPLRDDVGQKNQRIGSENQDRSRDDRAKKTDPRKTADQIQIESAQPKKPGDCEKQSNGQGAARNQIDAPHSRDVVTGSAGKGYEEKRGKQNRDDRFRPAEGAGRWNFGIRRSRCDLPEKRNINVNAGDKEKRLDHSAERRNEAVDGHAADCALRSVEAREEVGAPGFQLRHELARQGELDLVVRASEGAEETAPGKGRPVFNNRRARRTTQFLRLSEGIFDLSGAVDQLVIERVFPGQNPAIRNRISQPIRGQIPFASDDAEKLLVG